MFGKVRNPEASAWWSGALNKNKKEFGSHEMNASTDEIFNHSSSDGHRGKIQEDRLLHDNLMLRRQVEELEAANRELRFNHIPNFGTEECLRLRDKNRALEEEVFVLETEIQRLRHELLVAPPVTSDVDPAFRALERQVDSLENENQHLRRRLLFAERITCDVDPALSRPSSGDRANAPKKLSWHPGVRWAWDSIANEWVSLGPKTSTHGEIDAAHARAVATEPLILTPNYLDSSRDAPYRYPAEQWLRHAAQ